MLRTMDQPQTSERQGEAISRWVRSCGSDLHYRFFNPDGQGDGLLLTHGVMAHSHWWDEIAPAFTDRFRVVAMDTAGMGDSEHRSSYLARELGEDLVAVIKDARLAPVTIVAHSFSGNMALHACGLAPELIRRVIIIDSRIHFPTLPVLNREDRPDRNVARKAYATREDAVARYRLFNVGTVPPERLRYVAEHGLTETDAGWVWKFDPAFDAELGNDPARSVPAGITTPVDYIYGQASEVGAAVYAAELQSFVNNCGTPIAVPGHGHNMMLESPELVTAVLRSLFARPVA